MSNILNINTSSSSYNEWNDTKQCVGFVKGTQAQAGFKIGAYGNGKDVARNLIADYGYDDLKKELKRGAIVSLGATSTNSYGHVVMINDMDTNYVYVAEGNFNGDNNGVYRTAYKQSISDFKKRSGGIVATAINPKWNTSSSQYYVNLASNCDDNGIVGVYNDGTCTKKVGDIKPVNYGGLSYTNLGNATGKSQSGKTTCKIRTSTYGDVWVTMGYSGRSRDTSRKYTDSDSKCY